MKVYLAGKVPKGDEIGAVEDWRLGYQRELSNLPEIAFLSPDDPTLDESLPLTVFGHDCFLIQEADVIVVNASTKLGVGTAQELLIAKYFCKPVVSVLPRHSHHRRQDLRMHAGIVPDWIHPFIHSTSDVVVDDVSQAADWLRRYVRNPGDYEIKDISIIKKGIQAYLDSRGDDHF